MHMMGRILMQDYPIVIACRGQEVCTEILTKHNFQTKTLWFEPNDYTVTVIEVGGHHVPTTIIDGELPGIGLYFFFKPNNPGLFHFKLKYHKYDV